MNSRFRPILSCNNIVILLISAAAEYFFYLIQQTPTTVTIFTGCAFAHVLMPYMSLPIYALCFAENEPSRPGMLPNEEAGVFHDTKQPQGPWIRCFITATFFHIWSESSCHSYNQQEALRVSSSVVFSASLYRLTLASETKVWIKRYAFRPPFSLQQHKATFTVQHCYHRKAVQCWLCQLITPANSWGSAEQQMNEISTL